MTHEVYQHATIQPDDLPLGALLRTEPDGARHRVADQKGVAQVMLFVLGAWFGAIVMAVALAMCRVGRDD
jgi:hypothetical protein